MSASPRPAPPSGAIKSACGLGILLEEGIGDTLPSRSQTIRAGDPRVLDAAFSARPAPTRSGAHQRPTCGRCQVDLIGLARGGGAHREPGQATQVAVMGCVVNGPGGSRRRRHRRSVRGRFRA
ncbi:MAG: flavodoxin-dependent (E)-4-hydroxy-3-methylbut-2-enyl-diphosphate synthase [Eggerthellaceae bacterium]